MELFKLHTEHKRLPSGFKMTKTTQTIQLTLDKEEIDLLRETLEVFKKNLLIDNWETIEETFFCCCGANFQNEIEEEGGYCKDCL
jgi:hypothetical protein